MADGTAHYAEKVGDTQQEDISFSEAELRENIETFFFQNGFLVENIGIMNNEQSPKLDCRALHALRPFGWVGAQRPLTSKYSTGSRYPVLAIIRHLCMGADLGPCPARLIRPTLH